MATLALNDWKSFLNARLIQEKGDDKQALDIFDELLKQYPTDPHLLAARTYALQRLGRGDAATAQGVQLRYAELGRKLIGDADRPEAWTSALSTLLDDIKRSDQKPAVASALVIW